MVMSLIEELRNENTEIKELIDVLSKLTNDESLRTNKVFCELLQQFQDKVDNHLRHESRSIYSELLNHDESSIKKVASDFLSNTHELEKIKSKYIKRWCHQINVTNHDEFKTETKEFFKLINDRIQMEESHLFKVL